MTNPDMGMFYCVATCRRCSSSTRRCAWLNSQWVCWRCAKAVIAKAKEGS